MKYEQATAAWQVTEPDVKSECSYADAFGRAILYCLCKK
ncbi:hypothetical protein [Escherichia phage M01]|nr:hypothetical protein QCF74_gp73 [Escherichia phage SZH-1]UMO77083.1 hypothetical protein fBCEco01_09 [Escherichia phage fBC-Eco01]URG18209.1 hypothetical protein [Escherichia phage SZH-1]WKW35254.1 hypothetical protein [Escherichia phage M01]